MIMGSREPRQSARLTAKRDVQAQTPSSAATAKAPTKKKAAPERPTKRQKNTASGSNASTSVPREVDYRKIRGKRGMLKNITEMPMDILMEILGQLEPIDLLHISRATKVLHAIVTDSCSNSLWKNVYNNLSDPAPPIWLPKMNFLHYTNAVYGRHCQFCASPRGTLLHYGCLVRMCLSCGSQHLLRSTTSTSALAESLCLTAYMGVRKSSILGYAQYMLKEELERHERDLKLCITPEAIELYKNTWSAKRAQKNKFASELQAWYRHREYRGMLMFHDIRKRRRDAIVANIKALGYGEEFTDRSIQLDRLPGVKVSAELTDRIWENMKDKIIGVYEYQRQEHIKQKMIQVFQARIRHLDSLIKKVYDDIPKPHILAPTSNIIRNEYAIGVQLNIDSFATRIVEITKEWKAAADKVLLDLIVPEAANSAMVVEDGNLDMRPLELATTFFKCHWCPEALSYPRVLAHSCLMNRKLPDTDDDDEEQQHKKDESEEEELEEEEEGNQAVEGETKEPQVNYGIPKTTPEGVWNKLSVWCGTSWNEGNELTVDEEAANAAQAIILACGEDPATLTSAKMEEMDIRVECMRCSASALKKGRTRTVMTWSIAILHNMEFHFEEPHSAEDWRLITDETDLAKVKELEEMACKRAKLPWLECRLCDYHVTTASLKGHMSGNHGIQAENEKELKKHVFLPYDTPMKIHPYAVRI